MSQQYYRSQNFRTGNCTARSNLLNDSVGSYSVDGTWLKASMEYQLNKGNWEKQD